MQRYIIRIWPDGEAEYLQCNSRGTLSLRVLQDLVGGPIEAVPTMLSDGWAREDGARVVASLMAAFGVGPIVGPAVIMAGRGDELIGLLPGAAQRIMCEWLTGDEG